MFFQKAGAFLPWLLLSCHLCHTPGSELRTQILAWLGMDTFMNWFENWSQGTFLDVGQDWSQAGEQPQESGQPGPSLGQPVGSFGFRNSSVSAWSRQMPWPHACQDYQETQKGTLFQNCSASSPIHCVEADRNPWDCTCCPNEGLMSLAESWKRPWVYKDTSFWPASPETCMGSASEPSALFFHFHRFSDIVWSFYMSVFLYLYLYAPKSLYLYNHQIFKDYTYAHTHTSISSPSSLSATACCHFLRGSCHFWWGDRIPWIFLGLWIWQFFTGYFASKDLDQRV